jgi:hypothetical protein
VTTFHNRSVRFVSVNRCDNFRSAIFRQYVAACGFRLRRGFRQRPAFENRFECAKAFLAVLDCFPCVDVPVDRSHHLKGVAFAVADSDNLSRGVGFHRSALNLLGKKLSFDVRRRFLDFLSPTKKQAANAAGTGRNVRLFRRREQARRLAWSRRKIAAANL